MAIFGKTGLQAAALYLATLWALYGQKDAGFKKGEEENIVSIASRKNKKDASSSDKKGALQQLRTARYDALLREAQDRPGSKRTYEVGKGQAYEAGGKFQKAYTELPYSR